MPDIFQTATEGLDDLLRSLAGRSVTYTRGPQSITVSQAVIAAPRQQTENVERQETETEYRDWLIKASVITFGDPQSGDTITDAGEIWEVIDFERADPDGVTLQLSSHRVC